MNFEWDENKRQSNIARHGVDFISVLPLFDDPHAEVLADTREDYGEDRFILLGLSHGKLYQVVFTLRGDHDTDYFGSQREQTGKENL